MKNISIDIGSRKQTTDYLSQIFTNRDTLLPQLMQAADLAEDWNIRLLPLCRSGKKN